MPTGYTAALYEGKAQTFEDFTLNAARAMGAAVMERDDAPGPIKGEAAKSSYYETAHEGAVAKLAELADVTLFEWAQREKAGREEEERLDRERDARVAVIRARYEAMLAEVEAWNPPTSEHENLKKFMRDQLEESIKFDCTPYTGNRRQVVSAQDFKTSSIERAERNVAYYADEMRKESERTESRNKWVRDLRDSLTTN